MASWILFDRLLIEPLTVRSTRAPKEIRPLVAKLLPGWVVGWQNLSRHEDAVTVGEALAGAVSNIPRLRALIFTDG